MGLQMPWHRLQSWEKVGRHGNEKNLVNTFEDVKMPLAWKFCQRDLHQKLWLVFCKLSWNTNWEMTLHWTLKNAKWMYEFFFSYFWLCDRKGCGRKEVWTWMQEFCTAPGRVGFFLFIPFFPTSWKNQSNIQNSCVYL